jgi:hypothetical protein
MPGAQETLQALSRHRTGARVALQHCPILLPDGSIVCETWRKSTALFLLLCCSIGAFAQSPPESQRSKQKDLADVTFHTRPVKVAIDTLGQ